MADAQSPDVIVREFDISTVVPGVATSVGAFAGVFRWGPVGERMLVDSEPNLVARVGKPTNLNAETFFTAANFLAYGSETNLKGREGDEVKGGCHVNRCDVLDWFG